MKKSVTISLEDDILNFIDEFAKQNRISRSGAISVITTQYRQNTVGLGVIAELMQMVKDGSSEEKIIEKEKELNKL